MGLFFENWVRQVEQAATTWPSWRRNLVVSIPLISFAWWVPAGWIEEHRRALGVTGWILILGYAFAIVLFSMAVAAGVRWWTARSSSVRADLSLGLGFCALAGVGYFVDGHVLVGLYEDFHLELFMGASLCVAFACWLFQRVLPQRFDYPKKVDLRHAGLFQCQARAALATSNSSPPRSAPR